MAAANSNIQLTGLDFDQIKNNLKLFLKSQNILKDANYEGSALSVLLDILAYNTHYQAHYLNMVANEMFLDTSQKRSSVISHCKNLGYTPKSYIAPVATINIVVDNQRVDSLFIPKFTRFLTSTADGINYTFCTIDEISIARDPVTNEGRANNVLIYQGEPLNYTFTYDEVSNPNAIFRIPDSTIDSSTLKVMVQNSTTDIRISPYKIPKDRLALNSESEVYFLQESLDGYYEIYFGDGVLGKKLTDGNVIYVSYLSITSDELKTIANGIDEFSLVSQPLGDYRRIRIETVYSSRGGSLKQSINSIKYIAPKIYASQERAVTVNDYIALIQNNSNELLIDSVNVWSGETNNPPIYGRVFVAIKPKGGYLLTARQKTKLKNFLIKPMSVLTVDPVIIDADYIYMNIVANVVYDPTRTLADSETIRRYIKQNIQKFSEEELNTFNATFSLPKLTAAVADTETSIIANDFVIRLQKTLIPTLNVAGTYAVNFDTPIKRDVLRKSVSISPSVQILDNNILRTNVFIEETPSSASSVIGIRILNPGIYYTSIPTITIDGDGFGATAHAEVTNGRISNIVLDSSGVNYTQATVIISGGGGYSAEAVAILDSQYGILRSYYFYNNKKIILNPYVGYVDYSGGIVNLEDFKPYKINNDLEVLSVNMAPDSLIISSKKERMLTIDVDDPNSIVVNLTAK